MSADPGFGVYVHWPFCEKVCPYCDFNVRAAEPIDEPAWRDALINDLTHYAADVPGRTVTSLYFGGGTPSLMSPATVAALIEATGRLWQLAPDAEITLETNPTSGERARLRDFRSAGVNRLSVGVQSLDDAALQFLGREHTGADGIAVLDEAAAVFERVTFDLIYARPGQSLGEWRRELGAAMTHAGGHVSLYQLTIESGTPFHRAKLAPADEDTAADLFEATQEIMTAAGYPAYEVSNHARPGDESRHNLTCWRGGDYLGVGPGAHGRLTIDGVTYGTHQIHNPARWLEKAVADGHGTAKRRRLEPDVRAPELLAMGLRLREGVLKSAVEKTGVPFTDAVDTDACGKLVAEGLLLETPDRLIATASGRQRLNALLAMLFR